MFSFIQKLTRPQRSLLLTCFFAFFANGTLSLTMGSVMPDLKAAYHLSDSLSGLFLSAHSAGNLLAGFLSGLLPLYLGERKAIGLMAALASVGFVMFIVWGNPVWLLLAFACTGLGRGSVTNFVNRTVNKLSGGDAVASNMLHGSFAVGAILAPMLFLVLRNQFGWRVGLGYVLLCGVISLCNFARMPLDQERPDRKDKGNSTLVFLKNPSFLILAMMMFCYLCSEYAINGWLVTYIQNKEGLGQALAAGGQDVEAAVRAYSQTMATLLWVVMLVGRIICALLSLKISQKKIMMVSSFGVTVFFALMLLSASVPLVTLSVAGLGLCMAGICPMIYADAAWFTNTYPMATGALLAFGSTGAIVMPSVVGMAAERFGFTGGMSAILVTICLLMVFATLNVIVKRRHETA